VKVWGKSVCAICVGKNIRNYIQHFLPLVLVPLCAFLLTVFVLCVLLSSYVYLLYYVKGKVTPKEAYVALRVPGG
jgi:hypothetical protein